MLGSGAAAFRWSMMYYLNDPIGELVATITRIDI